MFRFALFLSYLTRWLFNGHSCLWRLALHSNQASPLQQERSDSFLNCRTWLRQCHRFRHFHSRRLLYLLHGRPVQSAFDRLCPHATRVIHQLTCDSSTRRCSKLCTRSGWKRQSWHRGVWFGLVPLRYLWTMPHSLGQRLDLSVQESQPRKETSHSSLASR